MKALSDTPHYSWRFYLLYHVPVPLSAFCPVYCLSCSWVVFIENSRKGTNRRARWWMSLAGSIPAPFPMFASLIFVNRIVSFIALCSFISRNVTHRRLFSHCLIIRVRCILQRYEFVVHVVCRGLPTCWSSIPCGNLQLLDSGNLFLQCDF